MTIIELYTRHCLTIFPILTASSFCCILGRYPFDGETSSFAVHSPVQYQSLGLLESIEDLHATARRGVARLDRLPEYAERVQKGTTIVL